MNILLDLIIIVLALTIIYLFLIAPRMFNKPDRSGLFGVHYAHRGLFNNNSEAPENSLSALKLAVEAGYGIEMDVQLTKDEIPVIFHDESLMRMCNVDGKVHEYTLAELKKFRLASSNETIPTLYEALTTIDGKVPLILEYKLDVVQTRVCELANQILNNYKGIYCIESFHPYALMWYRKNRPDIIRGQLSMNFAKDENNRKKTYLWVMTNLLTNFLTRPDFIAYKYSDAAVLSRRICDKMGAMSVAYTIQGQDDYERFKKDFELFIFDSFILK